MGATKFIRLAVAGAFHTAIMNPASERLKQALQSVKMNPASIPLTSNVDAQSMFRRMSSEICLPSNSSLPFAGKTAFDRC